MWDNIVLEIINLRWLICTYVVIIVAFCILYWIGTAKFQWSFFKIRCFGALYHVSAKNRIAITLAMGRYLFILISAILCSYTGIYHVAILLVFSLMINVIEVNIKKLLGDLAIYMAVFAILLLQNILYHYYVQVERSLIIITMVILLGIFTALYSTYHFIVSYDEILKKEMKEKGILTQ